MAFFITRVELHDSVLADYKRLKTAMQSLGFTKLIEATNGIKYILPTAVYGFNGNEKATPDNVLRLAVKAATTTRRKYGIVVTQSAAASFVGLDPA
jgi:hypothetical protein